MMETGFSGLGSNFPADATYEACFGNLPDKTTYIEWKPLPMEEAKSHAIDVRRINVSDKTEAKSRALKKAMEMKALMVESNIFATGTNYTATSGSVPALMPIWWDTEIIDEVAIETPLWGGLVKHVSNRGLFADWTNQTARDAATFKAEGASLPVQDGTWTHYTKPIKFAYATGEVSGPMLAGSKAWVDALKLVTDDRYQALSELIEKQICQGTNNDSSGFEGFYDLVTTNTTDRSSGAIRLQDLDTAIDTLKADYPRARPNLMVTDPYTLTNIAALLRPYQVYSGSEKIAFGITAITYRGIPIITSSGMPTTSGSREIHIYDTRVVEMRVLQEPTMVPLAKDRDTTKFTIKAYLTMVIKAETFCYRIYGIA